MVISGEKVTRWRNYEISDNVSGLCVAPSQKFDTKDRDKV